MAAIGQRLEEFVLNNFPSKAEFARQLGWDPASATKYFKGKREPGKVMLKKLLDLGCSLEWLQSGHGDMYASNTAGIALRERLQGMPTHHIADEMAAYHIRRQTLLMKMFLSPVRAGMAPPMVDEDEGWELVSLFDQIQLPREGGWMLEVMGESMVADCILPGDRLIVSKTEPSNGDVVVAAYNGSPTVKRYATKGRTVWLYPSDVEQKRDPIKVLPDDTLVVWGVVHAIIHTIRRKPVGC